MSATRPRTRVPNPDAKHVKDFCESIRPGAQPQLLPVEMTPGASATDCFNNVRERIGEANGSSVYGWAIWEWPGVLIEGEFHAVWEDEAGALHDITPAPAGVTERLFLVDPSREYRGRQLNNIRRPLTDHPAVLRLIDAQDRFFAIMNRGERAHEHGRVEIPEAEIAPVILEIQRAQRELMARTPGRNDPCPCGSGKKYKRCCGANR